MAELWKVFSDRDTGAVYAAYTIRGTFDGEEEATRELIAYEKGISVEQVIVTVKARRADR